MIAVESVHIAVRYMQILNQEYKQTWKKCIVYEKIKINYKIAVEKMKPHNKQYDE